MRVGKRQVVSSGSIITHEGDDSVEIEYANLQFKFVFVSGVIAGASEPSIMGSSIGLAYTFTLTNFNNPLGTSWNALVASTPSAFGKTKNLYLALHVQAVGQGERLSRLINYTLSEEES
jgi:hypothetical protein